MKEFIQFSRLLGNDPALVQGAGGNTSFKIGNSLFVKASGYFLKNISKNQGYVCCNFLPIKKYLLNLKKYNTGLELPFNAFVEKNLDERKSFGKPSIETGLHAVIHSKYVFHTHSALANVLNFASGGERTIKILFPGALIIKYKNPGLELAHTLAGEAKKRKKLPNIIFLKNHGLITHHNNPEAAYGLTIDVQKKITAFLKQQKVFKHFSVNKKSTSLKEHMFPDSVVYSQVDFKNLPPEKKQVYYEICSMVNYTRNIIKRLHMRPGFLCKPGVNFLVNMEQEKYRIKLFKNL